MEGELLRNGLERDQPRRTSPYVHQEENLMSLAMSTKVATTTWNIDLAYSAAHFKVRHMMISNVKGELTHISGKLELDGADITKSRVEASVDAATINTREPQRDAHLKSADFLEVEKFPTLSFRSTGVEDLGEGRLRASGELTIHGVTRPVEL